MSLTDFVASNVSLAAAQSPTVQALNVGLVAAYHNHYADLVRLYATSSAVDDMVADGFSETEPAIAAVSAYAAAPTAPALVAIGRRQLPPTQVLELTCTDGTVGDAYAFTLVGSDGKKTSVAYTNVPNRGGRIAGAALSGTQAVTPGSTLVTFSAPLSLRKSEVIEFASQPGVGYIVAAATSSSVTANLTTIYTGPAAAATTSHHGGLTAVVSGSTSVTFAIVQTFSEGGLVTFQSQPGVYYALASPVAAGTAGTLTTPYTGPTNAATDGQELEPLAPLVLTAHAGGFDCVNGSAIVVTVDDQTSAVGVGDSVQFGSQLNVFYTVAAVSATQFTLTNPYSGVTSATTTAARVCTASTAADALWAQTVSQPNGAAVVPPAFPVYVPVVNVGTPSVAGAVVSFTQVPGALNDIQHWLQNGFHNLQLQDATSDPGIASDLTAIKAANDAAFYGVILDSNSAAEIEAAASWCEATGEGGKTFWGNTSDYGNTQALTTSDVFSELHGLSLVRSLVQQNDQQVLSFGGAASCGQILAKNPGSIVIAYKNLPLVPADSDTTLTEGQALVINSMTAGYPGPGGKFGNYYKSVAGENFVWPGCTPSGRFMDLTIGIDWVGLAVQAAVVSVLTSMDKVPFDDFGLGLIGDAIRGVLVLGSTKAYSFILPNGQDPLRPISVFVPKAADLTEAQRASRDVTGFAWSAGIQGAIQNAVIDGTLIP